MVEKLLQGKCTLYSLCLTRVHIAYECFGQLPWTIVLDDVRTSEADPRACIYNAILGIEHVLCQSMQVANIAQSNVFLELDQVEKQQIQEAPIDSLRCHDSLR